MKYLKEASRISQSTFESQLEFWALGYRSGWMADYQVFEVECWTFHVCLKLNPKITSHQSRCDSCNLTFTFFYLIKFEMF